MSLELVYEKSCPVCGGNITLEELLTKGVCSRCASRGTVQPFRKLHDVDWVFEPLGIKPWGAQRIWARRFLRGESFAMIAPTGSGKTVAALAFALANRDGEGRPKKSLIIVPTATLAYQLEEKLRAVAGKVGRRYVAVHSLSKKPSREELLEADIIVTTSASLVRGREYFRGVKVDAVFVDDVDGFLRRSKAIDTVFDMLDVSEEQLMLAEKLIKMRSKRRVSYDELALLSERVRLRGKQIVVSGATQSARRTKRVKLLSELVGFSIGSKVSGVRRILDTYVLALHNLDSSLIKVVKRLGRGGLVFVQGSENAVRVAELLRSNGVKAEAYVRASKRLFRKFIEGEIEVLVGTATTRSSLVRGIDLPESVRYAVFYGVPKFRIRVSVEEFTPARMLVVLGHLLKYLENSEKVECGRIMDRLRKIMGVSRRELERIKSGEASTSFQEYVVRVMNESIEFFKRVIARPEIRIRANISGDALVYPDVVTYIQASGRTSRLTVGGMTQGVSVVLVDDPKAFKLLVERLEPLEITFRPLSSVDLDRVMGEVDKSRSLKVGENIELRSTLLVVESPTKARTIAYFYGRPMRRSLGNVATYEVMQPDRLLIIMATRGHFFDLDIDASIGFGAHFDPRKRKLTVFFKQTKPEVPSALRRLAQDVDEVIVATDPDAEGEKIGWDVKAMVAPFNANVRRARYHEVTKWAVTEAIEKPEEFDENLLHSQILRRIEDAWIGLPLSKAVQDMVTREVRVIVRELSKEGLGMEEIAERIAKSLGVKIRGDRVLHILNNGGVRWLSAGRVQTPVLGWIVQRTIENKVKVELLRVALENGLAVRFKAPRGTYKLIKEKPQAEIKILEVGEREIKPLPPFTTDTLLIEANRTLRLGVDETMRLAQELFESGLITYHRTDSTNVSSLGIGIAKQYLERNNMEKYYAPRSWDGHGGAHECIRPTRPVDPSELEIMVRGKLLPVPIPLGRRHIELYGLIFRRFMASQMKPVKVREMRVLIRLPGVEVERRYVTDIVEHGFDLVQPIRTLGFKVADGVYGVKEVIKKLVGEKPLYAESSLIRMMKEKNIGRPSTYAITIEKLRRRYYVYKVRTGQLVATKLGTTVYRFLEKNYYDLVNEDTTRRVLETMDRIERGEEKLIPAVAKIYRKITRELGESYGLFLKKSREKVAQILASEFA